MQLFNHTVIGAMEMSPSRSYSMSILFAIIQSFDHSAIEPLQPLQLRRCLDHAHTFFNHSAIQPLQSFKQSLQPLQLRRCLDHAHTFCNHSAIQPLSHCSHCSHDSHIVTAAMEMSQSRSCSMPMLHTRYSMLMLFAIIQLFSH